MCPWECRSRQWNGSVLTSNARNEERHDGVQAHGFLYNGLEVGEMGYVLLSDPATVADDTVELLGGHGEDGGLAS